MASLVDLQRLCSDLSSSILGQLQDSASDWSTMRRPQLFVQALVRDEEDTSPLISSTLGTIFTHLVDLSDLLRNNGNHDDNPATMQPGGVDRENNSHLPTPPPPPQPAAGQADGADSDHPSKRRKLVGCLRPARSKPSTEDDGRDSDSQRQMQIAARSFPKRRPPQPETPSLQAATLDKFITGVWEGIHGAINPSTDCLTSVLDLTNPPPHQVTTSGSSSPDSLTHHNLVCRRATHLGRTSRALEVVVQARWTEHFAAHVAARCAAQPHVSRTRHHTLALAEAAADFGWSEKELRNRMAVWQGYRRLKDAAGWAALVFAGAGLYRFCKYRVAGGLDAEGLRRLARLRGPFLVAADTIQPRWRELLAVIGAEAGERVYTGHPHDWVVKRDEGDPVALRETYLKWDRNFRFEQLDECVLDEAVWEDGDDPRWVGPAVGGEQAKFTCETCGEEQSDNPTVNLCRCFPGLFEGGRRMRALVQVFRTPDGRNNGLLALCPFERGAGIGEFVGLVTRGLHNLDVMECDMREDGAKTGGKYQIWQGRMGNFTRFVNHSCKANAQFQRFVWRGRQRVVLTSKGITAGTEITVDYSEAYWKGLDKQCLCGEACCRYPGPNPKQTRG